MSRGRDGGKGGGKGSKSGGKKGGGDRGRSSGPPGDRKGGGKGGYGDRSMSSGPPAWRDGGDDRGGRSGDRKGGGKGGFGERSFSSGPPAGKKGGKGGGKGGKGAKGGGDRLGSSGSTLGGGSKEYKFIEDTENPDYVHHVDVDLIRDRLANNGYQPPRNPVLEVKPASLISERIEHFDDLRGLSRDLSEGLSRTGYDTPTPVQSLSLPIGLQGKDMLTVAQTGSGKTLCFVLVMGHALIKAGREAAGNCLNGDLHPSALVVTPTRELALQIMEHASTVYYATALRTCGAYGGVKQACQLRELEQQCRDRQLALGADVLVGCPGRLADLLGRGRLSLARVRFLVLDEADRLLEMGFEKEMDEIVRYSDMPQDRQSLMYSATFDETELPYAEGYLNVCWFFFCDTSQKEHLSRTLSLSLSRTQKDYVVVKQGLDRTLPDQLAIRLEKIEYGSLSDEDAVHNIVKRARKTLIFVSTKLAARQWGDSLGRDAVTLHGDLTQSSREQALEKFRADKVRVLVATDVAQRGIDVQGVTDVVSVGCPGNEDDFLHRYGVFLARKEKI